MTLREVLEAELAKDHTIVGAKVDGRIVDVFTPFLRTEATKIEPIHASDPDGLRIVRHSAAHVMADAVQRLFPGTKVTFGPATDAGFYYDFDKPSGPFTDEDLAKIEDKMREIIKERRPFRREVVERDQARALFEKMGESYKREHIENIPKDEEVSLYRHGSVGGEEWVDLCEGPHVPNTRHLGAVKLVSVSGTYWRGDERNPMLQRVYGTAFPTKKELEEHLLLLEEAKKRDHRKLGKELDLFQFHEWAPAMPFFLPRGAHVYNKMIDFMRNLYVTTEGYEEVITPQVFDRRLFETSGHWENYRDNMFLPSTGERLEGLDKKKPEELYDQIVQLGLKPMNCPSHCLIFGSRRRSYRELPWRVADFGRLHRYERGGVVHGLARVRSFCQDDAHIFCAPDQMESEIAKFMHLFYGVYAAFGFTKIAIKLATRPDKRIGTNEQWDQAEGALEQALKKHGLSFEVTPGEGAFYGPKYEFHVEDALKRSWQLGTCQVDYGLPDRFELEYTGADGAAHRPVMLHRAVFGSLERFFAIYIEHTAGGFPPWIAPEQATIITVSDKQADYAYEVLAFLKSKGLRVSADAGSDKVGAKKRNARLMRVPYILTVGDREAAERKVSVWQRGVEKDNPMLLEEFAERLVAEAKPPVLAPPG